MKLEGFYFYLCQTRLLYMPSRCGRFQIAMSTQNVMLSNDHTALPSLDQETYVHRASPRISICILKLKHRGLTPVPSESLLCNRNPHIYILTRSRICSSRPERMYRVYPSWVLVKAKQRHVPRTVRLWKSRHHAATPTEEHWDVPYRKEGPMDVVSILVL
ncbi:hypothetical protein GYMLUDRAFT_838034 [Collybiopsis luxurians FD-317 M1]|uniref:Uncharacterized protein n=1 Tax=Collybiopsis luxurians FD-317 M1 TaxID=944289 RepID=A0A0D0AY57_9AGAR|nr:hypothetical protein GYMLUDRAFT_838034 [Collybiopsis luxurians FD-317 M1]